MKSRIPMLLFLSVLHAPLWARNVDLSTVPPRNTVQLTIYNSEDLTLVRETRVVTFKRGVNPLQFSWANTLIDPTSVELAFLTNADRLDVLDTTYPHDKPQMLYWNVQSEFDGEARIQITYFTSGITWAADYLAIADRDEKLMSFDGFVRVSNNSGEDYENAQVRLVVGTINLVEKIAQLARIPVSQVSEMRDEDRSRAQVEVAKLAMGRGRGGAVPMSQPNEKEIIKEGLSEYFIYTIEGTETIPNAWSKRMRSFQGTTVPFRIQYRYRPQEYGDQLVRMYLLANDTPSKLGTSPLPDGVVRTFRDNGRGGLSFLTAQTIKYIPIGDRIELNLGQDPEVIFELIKRKAWRDNIWTRLNGGSVLRRVEDGATRIEVNSSVAGWDEHATFIQRVRNYSGKPIDIEIRRSFGGHAFFLSRLNPVLHDFQTVQWQGSIESGRKLDMPFEIVTRQGINATQRNVTVQDAQIAP